MPDLRPYHAPTDPADDRLLSRQEAAEFLGVKPGTLAAWAATKRYPLPMVKVGRYARYRLSDLRAFLESRTAISASDLD